MSVDSQQDASQPQITQSAVETKKRQFAKALVNLDSITGRSPTTLTPASSVTSLKRPPTAAAAFDEARERASKRLRHSTSTSSLQTLALASAASTPKKAQEISKEPPNFSPWSQEAFLVRLRTFSSVSKWHLKPEQINEVEWAKRGWTCVNVNTVRCKGGCEKSVVVDLEASIKKPREDRVTNGEDLEVVDNEAELEQALAARYKDVIISGHAETCLWRKDGCKDNIYHLQVVRPSIWQPELRKRYKSVIEVSAAIESVKIQSIDRESTNSLSPERLLKDLPQDVLDASAAEVDSIASVKALDMALHGWRGTTASGSDLLQCEACFQRVGLWMYQPDYKPAHAAGDDDDDVEGPASLNLVELHRDHCPWRNSSTQKASGSMNGLNACQILNRVVSTYARDYRRRYSDHAEVASVESNQNGNTDLPEYSKDEIARQDKERESRLRKLKSLFSIKRRSAKVAPKAATR